MIYSSKAILFQAFVWDKSWLILKINKNRPILNQLSLQNFSLPQAQQILAKRKKLAMNQFQYCKNKLLLNICTKNR